MSTLLSFGLILLSFAELSNASTCLGSLTPDDVSAQMVSEAVDTLAASTDVEAQLRAVNQLVIEGERVIRAGGVNRKLHRTLKSIMPTLFNSLFSDHERTRRASAYAIATFRKPGLIDNFSEALATRDSSVEAGVRDEIEAYLLDRKVGFFQFVHLDGVAPADDGWNVRLIFEIKDELPLYLDGRAPRAQRPRWLTARPVFRVVMHEMEGRFDHDFTFHGRNGRDLILRGQVDLTIPRDDDPARLEMFFDFYVDGRFLDRMVIDGEDVVKEANSPR